jgi:hypothetical protein
MAEVRMNPNTSPPAYDTYIPGVRIACLIDLRLRGCDRIPLQVFPAEVDSAHLLVSKQVAPRDLLPASSGRLEEQLILFVTSIVYPATGGGFIRQSPM